LLALGRIEIALIVLMLGLVANLSDQAIAHEASTTGSIIWGAETGSSIAPWSVCWRLETR